MPTEADATHDSPTAHAEAVPAAPDAPCPHCGRGPEDDDAHGTARLQRYVTGEAFRRQVQGAVAAFTQMQRDLQQERGAVLRLLKRREQQLQRAQDDLAALWGALQGLAGPGFGDLDELAMPAGDDDDDGERGTDDGASSASHDAAPVVLREEDLALVELFFALIPADGTAAGNMTLRPRFEAEARARLERDVGEADYDRCRAVLLGQGRIRKGKGRGGSVLRAEGA